MKSRWEAPDFFGETRDVAQRLLGCMLVRTWKGRRIGGIIVETEAYLATGDPASHSFAGLKNRNAAMFRAAGILYVYSIHAKYCLNIVTEPEGIGAAVLIRALEPCEGVDVMRDHRGTDKLRELCSGPARLCQAIDITTVQNGIDLLTSTEVWIEAPPDSVREKSWAVTASARIGISSAQEFDYRYFIDGHAGVSGLARFHRTKRGWWFEEPNQKTMASA